jgi:periplasmic protein TonB
MSELPTDSNAIEHIGLERGPVPDRLPPMLFLAALVHGILIIGITFNAALSSEPPESISLEVTIVADPDQKIDRPEKAEYLAQASQQGGGNTQEQVRPSAPLQSEAPIDNIGQDTGDSLSESLTVSDTADQVLSTRSEQQLKAADKPRDNPSPDESIAIALESGAPQTLPLPKEDRANLLIHDQNLRQLVTSVDTKESVVAGYLQRWKTKIETIGVKYFPDTDAMQGINGSPTLEVTISASGQLAEVVVRHSSGSKVVDQAALKILRRAAPFDPFPEAIRVDYDQLRFAYKWKFNEISVSTTAQAN